VTRAGLGMHTVTDSPAGVAEPIDFDHLADRMVMSAAVRGDRAAFDQLVRRHTPRMYRVALRVLGTPTDAEDVVQDAWIAAWRALPGYRGDAAAATWLYRVVTNTALGHLRRRRPTVGLDRADLEYLVDTGPGPEASAVRSADTEAVHRALARLEPSQRAAVVLREFEGLSYEEVAEVLDTTVAAVRSRLHRGRAALYDHLLADPGVTR
jgi:RNA polymerase sigma-70 factor, ECF subfamily